VVGAIKLYSGHIWNCWTGWKVAGDRVAYARHIKGGVWRLKQIPPHPYPISQHLTTMLLPPRTIYIKNIPQSFEEKDVEALLGGPANM
jgi:hypothetical protein